MIPHKLFTFSYFLIHVLKLKHELFTPLCFCFDLFAVARTGLNLIYYLTVKVDIFSTLVGKQMAYCDIVKQACLKQDLVLPSSYDLHFWCGFSCLLT